MATRKTASKDSSEASATNPGDPIEAQVVAFASQLGFMVGTVQAKAEGWLDRKTLSQEISRIRDKATALLDRVNGEITAAAAAAQRSAASSRQDAKQTAAGSDARPGRGPVDAPGKRHRRPPPQERLDKRMGEPEGKHMGQKSARTGRRGGRG